MIVVYLPCCLTWYRAPGDDLLLHSQYHFWDPHFLYRLHVEVRPVTNVVSAFQVPPSAGELRSPSINTIRHHNAHFDFPRKTILASRHECTHDDYEHFTSISEAYREEWRSKKYRTPPNTLATIGWSQCKRICQPLSFEESATHCHARRTNSIQACRKNWSHERDPRRNGSPT